MICLATYGFCFLILLYMIYNISLVDSAPLAQNGDSDPDSDTGLVVFCCLVPYSAFLLD